jgi:hypothetical protein
MNWALSSGSSAANIFSKAGRSIKAPALQELFLEEFLFF